MNVLDLLANIFGGLTFTWANALMLLIGYAFDSADGQLSRLTGRSSPAGEWLDHMVDATKVVSMPLALGLGLYLHDVVPVAWLVVQPTPGLRDSADPPAMEGP